MVGSVTPGQPLPYMIESVSFNDAQITITYTDMTKVSQKVQVSEVIMFQPDVIEDVQLNAVLELLCDLVDDATVALRQPPQRLR